MSDISGVGNFGNDPFLSALQRQQQGDDLLQQQQRALDIAAQRNRETQALSDDLGRTLRQRDGVEGDLSALGQVAGETADTDSLAASPFQRDNNDASTGARRQEPDRVEISREAQQRLSQDEPSPPPPGESLLPEEDDPLIIDTAQEQQEIELSEPLDRGNNETAAGRELGQVLDQFS